MSHPDLSDEQGMGLSPLWWSKFLRSFRRVNARKHQHPAVEQNAQMALAVSHRAYVVETGKITLEGKADDLLQDEKVVKAYLGAD